MSPECQAHVNAKQAEADGYVMYHGHYSAGHVSRAAWAKPFVMQYLTGVFGGPGDSKLENRWWALKWWLPVAVLTKGMSSTKREEIMTQLLHWWEAGDFDQIDALIGGLELAREAL